jgi:hypothetical protein
MRPRNMQGHRWSLCLFRGTDWQRLRHEANLLDAWIPGNHGHGPPVGRGLEAGQESESPQEARVDERTAYSSFPCPRETERAAFDLARYIAKMKGAVKKVAAACLC